MGKIKEKLFTLVVVAVAAVVDITVAVVDITVAGVVTVLVVNAVVVSWQKHTLSRFSAACHGRSSNYWRYLIQ